MESKPRSAEQAKPASGKPTRHGGTETFRDFVQHLSKLERPPRDGKARGERIR